MKNLILIPTDFSEVCNNAIRHGIEIAGKFNNNILLCHIIDRHTRAWLHKEQKSYSHIDELLQKTAMDIASKYGIMVQTISREGTIFKEIARVAEDIDAEVILLGTHGKTGIQKLTGSFALRVVARSPVPVIIFHSHKVFNEFNRIVFPVDTSLVTKQKITWAVHIAKKYNSKVFLYQIRETSEKLRDKLKVIIKQATQIFDTNEIKYQVDEAGKEGKFAMQVTQFADMITADMIMIMTNENENYPNFTLGPWDEKIMFNKSKIPVMCINPHDYESNEVIF